MTRKTHDRRVTFQMRASAATMSSLAKVASRWGVTMSEAVRKMVEREAKRCGG